MISKIDKAITISMRVPFVEREIRELIMFLDEIRCGTDQLIFGAVTVC